MAGDWIKVECVTPDKPEVDMMANHLGIDHDSVVGKLLRLWIWADQQSISGNGLSVTKTMIDRITFVTGFCDALKNVGWIDGEDGNYSLTNFEKHNGSTAKDRAATNRRVAKSRAKAKSTPECNGESVTNLLQKPLPEKRRDREESILNNNTPPTEGNADQKLLKAVWEIFPEVGRRRSSKKEVAAEWKKIKKTDRPTQEAIVESLKGWIACPEWQRDNCQAVQGVHLWIKNERWDSTPQQFSTPQHQVTEFIGNEQ